MTRIRRLAPITHGTPGPCACCDRAAAVWYRTSIIADGRITVAARYCEEHDPESGGTGQLLGSLTVADVARLSPRRARRAAKRVAAKEQEASAHRRRSADMAGASSLTHTHSLLGGVAGRRVQRRLTTAAASPAMARDDGRTRR